MLSGLPGIMSLASASGEELGNVCDIVTDALTAFGLTAADSAHFSDVLAQAAASSNTNVGLMGNSFRMVATSAGALGYSIDDVAVALGTMANNGLKGEMAGAALATMFTRMSGTNSNATKAMEDLNLQMFNMDGSAKDLSVFLDELRDAFEGLTEHERTES
jgi:TP901 family phage tail tape measure protein